MIISSTLLKNSLETYNKNKRIRENYDLGEGISTTVNLLVDTLMVIFFIMFFIMELLVMMYAIIIAITCTKSGAERVTHLILAVTVTLPYMLLNVIFNKCAIDKLRSSKSLLPNISKIQDNYPSTIEEIDIY